MDVVTLVVDCFCCDLEFPIDVKASDIVKYQEGVHIQVAFPYLTSAERELLISGTCGPCFDKMFPGD